MKENGIPIMGLFPAQAGVIPGKKRPNGRKKAFPRASGGDPNAGNKTNAKTDFSPRKRG